MRESVIHRNGIDNIRNESQNMMQIFDIRLIIGRRIIIIETSWTLLEGIWNNLEG